MRALRFALPLLAVVSVGGCQTGAGTGALGGAALGGLAGSFGGNAGWGALIGAGAGAGAGYLYDQSQQSRERAYYEGRRGGRYRDDRRYY